jgi:hypothetical protein
MDTALNACQYLDDIISVASPSQSSTNHAPPKRYLAEVYPGLLQDITGVEARYRKHIAEGMSYFE